MGGTVGGYITFSGAHRLIDAGITGEKNLKEINKSSVMGMIIATIVRIFLFLAVLGVVVKGVTLDAANPAADAFKQGLVKSDTVLQVWFFCAQQSHPLSVQLILQFPS